MDNKKLFFISYYPKDYIQFIYEILVRSKGGIVNEQLDKIKLSSNKFDFIRKV
jgi:hypothetical protein